MDTKTTHPDYEKYAQEHLSQEADYLYGLYRDNIF